MTQQTDTITLDEGHDGAVVQPLTRHREPTVAEILRRLPADATPEQQDSAVQAAIKPSEIAWSEDPDTLHLPGMPAGHSTRNVILPQYYRESFFTGKPYYDPDHYYGRPGVAGDPVPYAIARDNVITALLLGCFILTGVSLAGSLRFMTRQAKDFFRVPRRGGADVMTETSGEFRFQFFLVFQTCLLEALIYFFHVQVHVTDTFTIDQYQVIGLFCCAFIGYAALKLAAYWAAGMVFFDKRSNERWLKSALFLMATEGVLLYPVVLLQAYFGSSLSVTFGATIAVTAVFKALAFYRAYNIFFRAEGRFLQNILYFCTLEIMPMVMQWGVLTMMSSYLKVNI